MIKLQAKNWGPAESGTLVNDDLLKLGALNLIEGCLGDVVGKEILIVAEDPQLGWYDAAAPTSVASLLGEMGAIVKTLMVGAPENDALPVVQRAIDTVDEVIFFARIGDQGRFKSQYNFVSQSGRSSAIMCYARNASMLASGYGLLTHSAMVALKDAVDEISLGAHHIQITCPLGTNIEGSPGESRTDGNEVVVSRYPMGVPKPVLVNGFTGVVKLSRFLTSAGSKVYEPAYLELPEIVTVQIDGTRMVDITGSADLVAAFKGHYEQVAAQFGLDAFNIDSWHAGIHPLMGYDMSASADPERWSQTVFSNPRVLHFHTCGLGPPGEICWMIIDPTIVIDGVALWENGQLHPERFAQTMGVLRNYPELAIAFAAPIGEIGLGDAF